ncbi:hypothetical protein CISIN_1g014395mg [Citrus sinensis]|uniref:Uncharacterized protein n=1 Tax=Citrus sinensis TaxID=2711 RepID=A0A067DHK1_CITSI|nr:hypothetical protein CISIN_1g014395mg [Citrus sinensis]
MQAAKKPGVIINMGSSAGLYPMYNDPIYSASKGGVVLFTRSLTPYKRKGIRINVLCPEFVQTEMGLKVASKFIDLMGGFVPMEMVVKGAFELITDESKAGSCLWITNRRGMEYWPTSEEKAKYLVRSSGSMKRSSSQVPLNLNVQLPESFEKLLWIYGQVNFSSGRYFSDGNDIGSRLPFDAGFEAVGLIAAVGDSVNNVKVGTPAAIMTFGSYAEFTMVPSKHILPVARPDPEVVAMLTSGLTASIALEQAGPASGKKVLVTAAAGGTGQFAVQVYFQIQG